MPTTGKRGRGKRTNPPETVNDAKKVVSDDQPDAMVDEDVATDMIDETEIMVDAEAESESPAEPAASRLNRNWSKPLRPKIASSSGSLL